MKITTKEAKRRQEMFANAQVNIDLVIDLCTIRRGAIEQLRKLGYSKKRSIEIVKEIIMKL